MNDLRSHFGNLSEPGGCKFPNLGGAVTPDSVKQPRLNKAEGSTPLESRAGSRRQRAGDSDFHRRPLSSSSTLFVPGGPTRAPTTYSSVARTIWKS